MNPWVGATLACLHEAFRRRQVALNREAKASPTQPKKF
jgi:hypothetical protein